MHLPPDVCIYIMYTHQMQDMYNTCCFPSPSATQPSPHPPFLSPPGRPQADGSPPKCRCSASCFFPINREFCVAPVAIVLALRGVQALGSVKRLETILVFCRYINQKVTNLHYSGARV